ncbi:MAG: ATPase, T2SS/T4P/T4SS family [Planctomycetota bacterium]
MSNDDDDVLGWLGAEADDDGEGEEELQDALDWLSEDEEDDPASADPGSTIRAEVDDQSGLGWLDNGEDAAPALNEDDEDDEDDEANVSIFSHALDDFFEGLETDEDDGDAPAEEGAQTIVTSRGRMRRRRGRSSPADRRIERLMSTLLRYLVRKDPVREKQLETIFRLTVGKLVDPIRAEVLIVWMLDGQQNSHLTNLFYSKSLFRNHPGLESKFSSSLEKLSNAKLGPNEGIVGKSTARNKSITSLDARNDEDFVNLLGEATGYTVRTMLTVPIADGEDYVVGALQVMNKDPNSGEEFFSFQDLKLLETIGRYLGRLIHVIRDPDVERTEDEFAEYYARMGGAEVINVHGADVHWDERLWEVVTKEVVRKYRILPLRKLDSKNLSVVMSNPLDQTRRNNFEAATDLHIAEVFVATNTAINEVLVAKLGESKKDLASASDFGNLMAELGEDDTETVEIDDGDNTEESSPIVKLANQVIEDAYARGASDIHIEPYENFARVRYRVDGTLQEKLRFKIKNLNPLISRLKIMSNLDIAERRLPQDGKIKFKRFSRRGLDIDLRVATGPMAFGEKVVMRILAKGSVALGLDGMGFSDINLEKYRWGCKQPYGMILNVGPTGSGKTTTLYSGLSEVNDVGVNIQTAEDPIEYPLDGINQMQMHKSIGLDFARALRCYLRMDPDIILVGEIRDLETAEIAIEASLTGHLLFSTLHTNDAAGTVTRFIEMGIEPFLVSSSLLVVCAQRLLRRTCDKCREEWTPTPEERKLLEWDPREVKGTMYKAVENLNSRKPCPKCNGVGYKGRCGTHEVLSMDDDIRGLINKHAPTHEIRHVAIQNGMKTIFQDALFKVKEGVTDLPDVIARVKADEEFGRQRANEKEAVKS